MELPLPPLREWRTGTSKEFWALIKEQRYVEAKDLLFSRVKLPPKYSLDNTTPDGDAEAMYELSRVYSSRLFGVTWNDSIVPRFWMTNAARLCHPRAIIMLYRWSLATIQPEVAARVMAAGDALSKFLLLRRTLPPEAGPERGFDVLDEALEANDPDAYFEAARYRYTSYVHAALLGHSQACAQCLHENFYDGPDALLHATGGLRGRVVRIGAAQGEGNCLHELAKIYQINQQHVLCAHTILRHPGNHVILSWIDRRKEEVRGAGPAWSFRFTREFYLYGQWQHHAQLTTTASFANFISLYRNVRARAQDAARVLMGLLRLRRRNHANTFPRDIASMVGRMVWESRELDTELWERGELMEGIMSQ